MSRIFTIATVFLSVMMMTGQNAYAIGALATNVLQGSIASTSPKQYVAVSGAYTTATAAAHAIAGCGAGCTVRATIKNQCVSVEQGRKNNRTAYTWAVSTSKSASTRSALSSCRSYGLSRCGAVAIICDGSYRN